MIEENNIDGVIITKLNVLKDERGWLAEIYRSDEIDLIPAMAYVSYTKVGVKRGPHEHVMQSDIFILVGPGDFELSLWDNRKESNTFGKHMKFVVGESNCARVIVPPGVVHGYKSISENGAWAINLPDKLFAGKNHSEEVDEIRHETDPTTKFKID
jgi:dTDP-4-dehydrorhamnose 3,5-epimerase